MQKHTHRAVEKTADNRYWQNRTGVEDAERGDTAEFRDYAPPSLTAADVPDRDDTAGFDDAAFKGKPPGASTG